MKLFLYMYGVVREVLARTLERGAQLVGDGEAEWEESKLLYADDTVLMSDSKKLERLVEEFSRACSRGKFKVNISKAKVMRSARYGFVGEVNIMMDKQVLKEVKFFKYLGSQVTAVRGVKAEEQQRVLEWYKVQGAVRSVRQ